MKDKTKGLLMLIGLALIIAGIALWGYFGYVNSKVPGVKDVKLGLDLAGGVSVTYQTVKENPTSEELSDLQTKLEKRASSLSTEAKVYLEGSRRINVDIPGEDDAEKVFSTLGNAGNIYFIYACDSEGHNNISNTDGTYVLAKSMDEIIKAGDVVIDGTDIAGADAATAQSQSGAIEYEVRLTLNDAGAKKFEDATKKCASYAYGSMQNIIAIIYDNVVYSAPAVKAAIPGGTAVITGSHSMEEARNLATIIRIGALPIEIESLRSNVVGATLGSRALKTSMIAGAIGFVLVCIYMCIFYRVPGVAASLSLITYLGLMLAMLLAFHVTLTLPGIAGIILSIGMAVDANVIIFTRIREELATGKTVRSSVKIGYRKALSAIIDGNVTTLIAAIVLYFRGNFRDVLLENDAGHHRVGNITASAHANDDIHRIRLQSDFADGSFVGKKSLVTLVSDLKELLVKKELPSLLSEAGKPWDGTPYDVNFKFHDAQSLLIVREALRTELV